MASDDDAAMGRDLDLCDQIEALGSPAAKRKARAQRRAIYQALKARNAADGLDGLSDDEILAELLG